VGGTPAEVEKVAKSVSRRLEVKMGGREVSRQSKRGKYVLLKRNSEEKV
jgi:formamidopyrimidine-DNA glycosylase